VKKELTHLIGGLLMLSSYYHSSRGFLPLLTIIPILMVSFATEKEKNQLEYIGLVGTTLLSGFFITHTTLGNTISLSLFILFFVLPLTIYWILVLSSELYFDLKAASIAISYFGVTIISFYALINYLNISEFIFAEGNTGPMALSFSAMVIVVLLPFYISINR